MPIQNLPTIETNKGRFFVKNIPGVAQEENRVEIYDEQCDYVATLLNLSFNEQDEVSKQEIIDSIESDDSI